MRKSEYDKTLLRRERDIKSQRRTNYWSWHWRGLWGVNTYKYWGIPALTIFFVIMLVIILIVWKCEGWILDMYNSMLPV